MFEISKAPQAFKNKDTQPVLKNIRNNLNFKYPL